MRCSGSRLSTGLALVALLTAHTESVWAQTLRYDELFDAADAPRAHCAECVAAIAGLSITERQEAEAIVRRSVDDDYSVSLYPLIFKESEFERLRAGVAQRGRALQELAREVYLSPAAGPPRYLAVMPESVVDRAIARARMTPIVTGIWEDPRARASERISFFYAPDIARGPDGRFWINEDNISTRLGGLGDMVSATKGISDALPSLASMMNRMDPLSFFRQIQEARNLKGQASVAFINLPSLPLKDSEPERTAKALRAAGIEVFDDLSFSRIAIHQHGVFAMGPNGRATKIDAIELFMPLFSENDAAMPFLDAWRRGLIELSETPGIEFLSDKEIGLYVDYLIELYLREKPIIPGIPGQSLDIWSHLTDRDFIAMMKKDYKKYVYKSAKSEGGRDVLIGDDFDSFDGIAKQLLEIRAQGFAVDWIRQDFVPHSQISGSIVGTRIFANVREGGVDVSTSGYGRGRRIVDGDQCVNMARGGHVHVLCSVPDSPTCQRFTQASH